MQNQIDIEKFRNEIKSCMKTHPEEMTSKKYLREIKARIEYQFLKTDGALEFPNNFEGDLLRIAYTAAILSEEKS